MGERSVKIYCIVSYAEYNIVNNIPQHVSAIPAVITLTKGQDGPADYQEPLGGHVNFQSTLALFPFYLSPAIFWGDYDQDLYEQQEVYVKNGIALLKQDNQPAFYFGRKNCYLGSSSCICNIKIYNEINDTILI